MKKKLIEVALPLEAINTQSAREKSIRHGYPSTVQMTVVAEIMHRLKG
jgi:putative DNA methylase